MYKLRAVKVSVNVNAHILFSEKGWIKLPMFLAGKSRFFSYKDGKVLLSQNSIEDKRIMKMFVC